MDPRRSLRHTRRGASEPRGGTGKRELALVSQEHKCAAGASAAAPYIGWELYCCCWWMTGETSWTGVLETFFAAGDVTSAEGRNMGGRGQATS